MTYYSMTSDAEYIHSLAVLDARYRQKLSALLADYNAGRIVVNAAHHEARAALLADYRAKEEAK